MSVRYVVDPIHSKIRLASLVALGVGTALGFFFIMPPILSLFPALTEWSFCIGGIGAIGLGALASWGTERLLVSVWPSGRALEVSRESITLHEPGGEGIVIEWGGSVQVMAWHFKIQQGGTPAPRGWHCVACQLAQEDKRIALYSFLKPSVLPDLAGWSAFKELPPRKRPSIFRRNPTMEWGSDELRIAERYRWNEGCELLSNDFSALMATIAERVPDWS